MQENLIEKLNEHLQLTDDYYIEQDKQNNVKVNVYKKEQDIDELIGSYIFENADLDEIFEIGKQILSDIWS